MTDIKLPDPCPPGKHWPAIIHRTRRDGNDAAIRNTCGICGRQIERDDPEHGIWVTEQQADEYNEEQRREAQAEYEAEMDDALHPESRCPPRE